MEITNIKGTLNCELLNISGHPVETENFAKLNVENTFTSNQTIQESTSPKLTLLMSGNDWGRLVLDDDGTKNLDLDIFQDSSTRIRCRKINSNSQTASHITLMDANGNQWFNTVNHNSDVRLKENIQELGASNNVVDDIKVYSFTFKRCDDKRVHYGVLAQELQEIAPELVYEDDPSPDDQTTYLGVNYMELIPLLIDKCHQQQNMINMLQKQVNQLMEIVGIDK